MMQEEGLRKSGSEQQLASLLEGELAFLRHRLPGLEHRESSDWDVAVRNPQSAGWKAEQMFGLPLIRVERRYVIQRYFEWGQLDFLPVFEWNGFEYLAAERFWSRVEVGEDGLPRPCIAHDALIAWLTGLLWGARHRGRYEGLLERGLAEDPAEFEAVLDEAFGPRLGKDLVARVERRDYGGINAQVLRAALIVRRIVSDRHRTCVRVGKHLLCELGHHWKPPFPWVAFLGPDGSGKSTVIEGLRGRLGRSRIGIVESRWWPEPLKEGEVPGPPVTDPHAKPARGWLLSVLKTLWLGCRWWKERLGVTGHLRAKKAMLISDRYYDDLLVDPRRYRYGASRRLAAAIFGLLPAPDLVLVLVGDPERIHQRKEEVPLEEMKRQMEAYRKLCEERREIAVEVDACLPREEVEEKIWQEFEKCLRDRFRASE